MIEFNITILYQFLNLLILLVFLNIFLFKPLLGAIRKRQHTIQSLTEGVDGTRKQTHDFEKQYEDVSDGKKRPILENKDNMISEANASAAKIIEKARSELAEELERVKAQIESEGKKVYETLRADVDRLSRGAAEKILQRSL
ncbi:MAG TPA: hypothetical protein VHO84_06870 [Syntrophorhabdaceae bacterium]|nr:hypothetical protein [Syntrophorhabdaceae bacterium]